VFKADLEIVSVAEEAQGEKRGQKKWSGKGVLSGREGLKGGSPEVEDDVRLHGNGKKGREKI